MTHERHSYMLQREDFLRVVSKFQRLTNGKHKLRIAWELRDKPLRYGELKRAVNAVGTTTIAESLLNAVGTFLPTVRESSCDYVGGSGGDFERAR